MIYGFVSTSNDHQSALIFSINGAFLTASKFFKYGMDYLNLQKIPSYTWLGLANDILQNSSRKGSEYYL